IGTSRISRRPLSSRTAPSRTAAAHSGQSKKCSSKASRSSSSSSPRRYRSAIIFSNASVCSIAVSQQVSDGGGQFVSQALVPLDGHRRRLPLWGRGEGSGGSTPGGEGKARTEPYSA